MPVADVLRRTFASSLTLDQMAAAVGTVAGIEWQVLENPADGRYLRGLTPNGVKVRIVRTGERWRSEVWFPVGPGWTRFTDSQKTDFAAWMSASVLRSVSATDERDEG